MTYELAKQRKDAGYPISLMSKGCENCWRDLHGTCTSDCQIVELPTLSELIEACGEHFVAVQRARNGEGGVWRATGNDEPKNYPDWGYSMGGSNPEEAVAKLWLALHTVNPVENRAA